ncbi:MAG: glycerophosphodiester phosphodiesterase [Actinomycetota bacterium]
MSERRFSQEGERLVVAHRGASAHEAENTIPAFESAITGGADVVEFDVRMTVDDVAVVMHDPDVSRTTDGAGLVRDLHLSEIKLLRIRTADGGETEVPTLEETLTCLSGRAAVDVEIKNIPGEPDFDGSRELVVEATLRGLETVGFAGFALLSSFNPLSIARSRELSPGVPTGLLTTEDVEARVALGFAHEQGHGWVLPFTGAVLAAGPSLAQEAHDLGMRLGTWITDDPVVAVELMRAGVDAVATNDPAAVVVARREAFGK